MLVDLLSTPLFAVCFGLVLGVGLLIPLIWSTRLPMAGLADIGLFVVIGTVFGGLIIALVLLLGYRLVAPAGFRFFGLAVVVGYLSALGCFAVITTAKVLRLASKAKGRCAKQEIRR